MSRTVQGQIDSPITQAYDLLPRRRARHDLLDLAQAAPQYPPADAVVDRLRQVATDRHGGAYTEVPGLPEARRRIAADIVRSFGGQVDAGNVVVTAGCNQAFCLAVSSLAERGDEVVLILPYYFNHDMWLRLNGIVPRYVDPGPDLVPTVDQVAAALTPRTRAIVVVTPGNPSGVTVPPSRIADLAGLARRSGTALVLDETYRSFRDDPGPPHHLFTAPAWDDVLVSLHSYSKDLALPGYRVGAVIASPHLNRQVAKLLDCVAVCAPRIGQEAVCAGLAAAGEWRAARAAETAAKRRAFAGAMAPGPGGFEVVSLGGFFGWVRHPFAGRPTADVVRELIVDQDILVVPGTAFMPDDRSMLRMSFANVSQECYPDLAQRLSAMA